jgi:hypothetical protein
MLEAANEKERQLETQILTRTIERQNKRIQGLARRMQVSAFTSSEASKRMLFGLTSIPVED